MEVSLAGGARVRVVGLGLVRGGNARFEGWPWTFRICPVVDGVLEDFPSSFWLFVEEVVEDGPHSSSTAACSWTLVESSAALEVVSPCGG